MERRTLYERLLEFCSLNLFQMRTRGVGVKIVKNIAYVINGGKEGSASATSLLSPCTPVHEKEREREALPLGNQAAL